MLHSLLKRKEGTANTFCYMGILEKNNFFAGGDSILYYAVSLYSYAITEMWMGRVFIKKLTQQPYSIILCARPPTPAVPGTCRQW